MPTITENFLIDTSPPLRGGWVIEVSPSRWYQNAAWWRGVTSSEDSATRYKTEASAKGVYTRIKARLPGPVGPVRIYKVAQKRVNK